MVWSYAALVEVGFSSVSLCLSQRPHFHTLLHQHRRRTQRDKQSQIEREICGYRNSPSDSTMTKRELSSTLKNLKFMQRAAQKEEKGKEEEVTKVADIASCSVSRRCVVIVEGDPHPRATRGRMSFRSFNPCIDKLDEDHHPEAPTMKSCQESERMSTRENGNVPDGLGFSETKSLRGDENGDHKRKQGDAVSSLGYPKKSPKMFQGNQQSSPNGSHNSRKKTKNEKLDWSVLRSPRYQNKKK